MAAAIADRRPVIGVTTARRGGRIMWWFNWLAIYRAGGRAVRVSPNRPRDVGSLDGLLVGGGDDIGLSLYYDISNKPELQADIRIDHERDLLERDLVHQARARSLPVLGICRGAQMINVARGGTLHRDIYDSFRDAPKLRTPLPRKQVMIEPGSHLHEILGTTECRVNALHHQSVDELGAGLQVVSRDAHGIVQAIELAAAQFVIGVQWHPEFLVFDRGQMRLFRSLVAAARSQRTKSRQQATAPPERTAEFLSTS